MMKSNMTLEVWDEPDSIVYRLIIPKNEWLLAELDGFDRRLIKESGGSGSVADNLLALERMAKRIEEALDRKERKAKS